MKPYRPWHPGFWKRYWITMRPYLLFISGIAGLSGLALIPNPNILIVALAFIPLFLSYGLGQALTDVFQTDTDAISSPYRPLVRGEIMGKDVLIISVGTLVGGVAFLAFINPVILIFGLLAVFGLYSYTYFKRRWWGGPPWNSWIVALLPLIGRLVDPSFHVTTEFLHFTPQARILLFTMLSAFFAYANFVVMGYFKDVSADMATGYETVQVKFGWKAGIIYSDIVSVLAMVFILLAILMARGMGLLLGFLLYAIAAGVNIRAQWRIRGIRDEKMTYGPIADTVRAFILYASAIVVAYKPIWIVFIVLYYLAYEYTIYRRPERSQI